MSRLAILASLAAVTSTLPVVSSQRFSAAPGVAPRLILLISVDTLRADRLGAYGSTLGLTPCLDALAAESQRFTAAFTPAPFTLPSMAAFMTSRHPQELGVTTNLSVVPQRPPRLAQWMSARGWATGAVVSNYVLRRGVGLARGFQRYDDQMLEREVARGAPERTGQETTRAALRLLDQLGRSARPILLWVHYQDPHGPYTPPARARALTLAREERAADGGRVLPLSRNDRGHGALPRYQLVESRRDVAFYRAGYNGEVAQVDGAVGELLQGVRRHGLWDRSILVFAADHGESLGEDDYWFAHGDLLSDALVRVPLLVRVPGRAPAVRDDAVSLIDVFPTVAALAGVPAPARARGRDLFAPGRQSAPVYLSTLEASAAACRGVVAEGFRYTTCPEREGAHEELSALPGNVRTPRLARSEALRRLRRHLAVATLLPAPAARQQHLTGADRAALQTLGYVSR